MAARVRRIDPAGWGRLGDETAGRRADVWPEADRFTTVEMMTRFIAEHAHGEIHVEDVAKAAGPHPNYAMNLFRRALDMTIKQAITRRRLDTAQSVLIASDHSIADIAFGCGFGSLSSFYDAFEKRFSVSPANFRKAALTRATGSEAASATTLFEQCDIGFGSRNLAALEGRPLFETLLLVLQSQKVALADILESVMEGIAVNDRGLGWISAACGIWRGVLRAMSMGL
jgi:AraC-like DNA-binding protein